MNRQLLLGVLPVFKNEKKVIVADQDVKDIVHEVLEAHTFFSNDYDKIAAYFWTGNIYDTCKALYNFCRDNIQYKIESEGNQTTKSPSAILATACGDCKHYAGFIGGVLDAINRNFDAGIKWNYRFASYEMFSELPQHVFIVAKDNEGEIWIDPVLKTFDQRLEPTFVLNKKISGMSLKRISGTNNSLYNIEYQPNTVGWTVETSTGYTNSGPTIIPKIGDPFYGTDYLGLSRYGKLSGTNLDTLTAQLQANIDKGPSPYTLSRDLVDKVLRDNVQNWNFYYPNGTSPIPRDWEDGHLYHYRLTITPDGRLTYATDEEVPHDWPSIHHLVDWANYLVQNFSDKPYIVLLDHLKRLGKGWKTPDKGSLWHVIHEGDVNFAKVTDFIGDIPGLREFLDAAGISMDSLIDFAQKALTGGPGTGSGGGTVTPPAPPAQAKDNKMLLIVGGAAALYFLTRPKRGSVSGTKNAIPLLLLGAGALLLLNKKTIMPEQPADQNEDSTSIPPTATPPIAVMPAPVKVPIVKPARTEQVTDTLIDEYKNFAQ